MLHLGSVYLIVKDMRGSLAFYTAFLGQPPTSQNYNRFAVYQIDGGCLALFNPAYDEDLIASNQDLEPHFNSAYLRFKRDNPTRYGNNFVLNFWVDDLILEYERVKSLGIGRTTEILYINIAAPYYCFVLYDPDDNQIEITGSYRP